MGGGLMQLVAYGAQDIYLTGNPQITFFKVVYRRHTNFSMEAIEQTFNGSANFGGRASVTVSRNGDLIHKVYYEADVTGDAANGDIHANPGSALIKEVELEIGGQRIDKHYGHWMEVWGELTESGPAPLTCTTDNAEAGTRTVGSAFQNMSGMGGVSGQDQATVKHIEKMFIPLQFWFCRNPGLALPLIALQYHEVKIITEFGTGANLGAAVTSTAPTIKLWVDYIYLDTDERRRFAQQSHEYLIEQLQFQNSSESTTHDLNFNHPVKELVWTGGVTSTAGAVAGPSTPLPIADTTYLLKLNGHDRFTARNKLYFTRTQVHAQHSGAGGRKLVKNAGATKGSDTIAVYSFALKPEEHQPSGTCNFSRIDNAQLVLGDKDALHIYAVNYNVLRIMSGMGGLAYSN